MQCYCIFHAFSKFHSDLNLLSKQTNTHTCARARAHTQKCREPNISTKFDWLTWSLVIENKTTVCLLRTPICVNSNLRSFRKRFSLYPSLNIISNSSQPILYGVIIIKLQKQQQHQPQKKWNKIENKTIIRTYKRFKIQQPKKGRNQTNGFFFFLSLVRLEFPSTFNFATFKRAKNSKICI